MLPTASTETSILQKSKMRVDMLIYLTRVTVTFCDIAEAILDYQDRNSASWMITLNSLHWSCIIAESPLHFANESVVEVPYKKKKFRVLILLPQTDLAFFPVSSQVFALELIGKRVF